MGVESINHGDFEYCINFADGATENHKKEVVEATHRMYEAMLDIHLLQRINGAAKKEEYTAHEKDVRTRYEAVLSSGGRLRVVRNNNQFIEFEKSQGDKWEKITALGEYITQRIDADIRNNDLADPNAMRALDVNRCSGSPSNIDELIDFYECSGFPFRTFYSPAYFQAVLFETMPFLKILKDKGSDITRGKEFVDERGSFSEDLQAFHERLDYFRLAIGVDYACEVASITPKTEMQNLAYGAFLESVTSKLKVKAIEQYDANGQDVDYEWVRGKILEEPSLVVNSLKDAVSWVVKVYSKRYRFRPNEKSILLTLHNFNLITPELFHSTIKQMETRPGLFTSIWNDVDKASSIETKEILTLPSQNILFESSARDRESVLQSGCNLNEHLRKSSQNTICSVTSFGGAAYDGASTLRRQVGDEAYTTWEQRFNRMHGSRGDILTERDFNTLCTKINKELTDEKDKREGKRGAPLSAPPSTSIFGEPSSSSSSSSPGSVNRSPPSSFTATSSSSGGTPPTGIISASLEPMDREAAKKIGAEMVRKGGVPSTPPPPVPAPPTTRSTSPRGR